MDLYFSPLACSMATRIAMPRRPVSTSMDRTVTENLT